MGKPRKTNEQFICELRKIKPDILPLECYPRNNHTKIHVACTVCGYIWMATPTALLLKTNGNGCPHCANKTRNINNRITHTQFIDRMSKINPNIEILETYVDYRTKLLCKCKTCNHEWRACPDKLLQSRGCPACANLRRGAYKAYSHDEFVKKLHGVNPDIKVIGKYKNSKTKLRLHCKKCGREWEATPFPLLKGVGCPHCASSKGELEIQKCLDSLGGISEAQKSFNDCKSAYVLKFDFYLPKHKICIEYDGKQHFEPVEWFGGYESFKKQVARDAIKTQYCIDNGIELIRIPYTEFDNIKNILEERLKNNTHI